MDAGGPGFTVGRGGCEEISQDSARAASLWGELSNGLLLSPGTSSWSLAVSLHPSSLVGLSRADPHFGRPDSFLTISFSSRVRSQRKLIPPSDVHGPVCHPMAPQVLPPSQICQRDWHWLGWQGPSMVYGTKDGEESPNCLSRLLKLRQEMKWAWT